MKEGTRVLVALGAAFAAGAAVAASGSSGALRAADAIAPVGTLWVNAIRMTVVPLIVSLLITGVAGARDMKSVGRLGARTLVVFVVLLGGPCGDRGPARTHDLRLLPGLGGACVPAAGCRGSGEPDGGRRAAADVRELARLACSRESRRSRGQRGNRAAHRLHAAPGAGHRCQPTRCARHPAPLLPRPGRRDARPGAVGGARCSRRDLRAGPSPHRARRRGARRTDRLLHRRVFRGQYRRDAARLSRRRGVGAHPDPDVCPRGAAGAAHRIQLGLVTRVVARTCGRRGRPAPARAASQRIRAPCRRLDVQAGGAGLVDDRGAVRGSLLRGAAARQGAWHHCVRLGLPRLCGAGHSTRRVHHAHAALPRHRPAGGGDRDPHRGRCPPRHVRDGPERYGRPRRRRDRRTRDRRTGR